MTDTNFSWSVTPRGNADDFEPNSGETATLAEAQWFARQGYLRRDPHEKKRASLTITRGSDTWACIAGDQLGFSSWKLQA